MSGPPIVPDGNRLVVFGSQLIGVLIVIVGLLTQQGELHSWRPTGTKNQVAGKWQTKERFARLWDDPLEDMPAFPIVPKKQSDSTEEIVAAKPLREPSPAESPASETPTPGPVVNYIFLWNILDARPLPESKERRLRIRYAIVSAILTEGYLPLHESVLASLFDQQKLVGYFETFRKAGKQGNGKYEYVCVIWTPKQSTDLPIAEDKLNAIKAEIGKRDAVSAQGDVRILHHGSSEDLYNYVAAPGGASSKQSISFMRATILGKDLEYLGMAATAPPSPSLQKITTDNFLVEALVRELSLRIPALNNTSKAPRDTSKLPRVVVFTESDTNYSRAIEHELNVDLTKENMNVKLDVFSYLRALDGRPEETRAPAMSEASKPQDVATSLLQGRAISETSFGTSQFDYLRRAAIGLEGNVVAVGILGSDIYDKMLVLQAVRPRLSSAIFFTTDLDALYLEREMQPFTRNLVVASADGLDANDSTNQGELRWKLPPMRDSYQTVLVKEVHDLIAPGQATEASREPPAHIFEIAPGKSVALRLPGSGFFDERISPFILRQLAKPWVSIVIFLLGLGNGFLILWAISTRQPELGARMVAEARTLVGVEIALAGLGLLFFLYMLWLSQEPALFGEPLALGVSIWPSVMIRLLAFLVAIVLLSLASYSLVVYGSPQEKNLKAALPENLKFRCRKGFWGLWGPSGEQSPNEFIEKLFAVNSRKRRVVIWSLVYIVFSFGLFAMWPPAVPARGALPLLIEKIVLSLGVALYIIHLIFCLDLHVSALRLLRQLRLSFPSSDDQAQGNAINAMQMLTSLSTFTLIIGKTLLYPLTVLILIILSRLSIFDNWVIAPSLAMTFALGAFVLVSASLFLWLEGARLKKVVLGQDVLQRAEKKKLAAINDGVFAAWYSQPIFSAIFSAAAVFGSLSIAGPLTRLFFAS
jgi:hypothetical protein